MYNAVAKDEIKAWLSKTGVHPGSMSTAQARMLLVHVEKNPFINGFNKVVNEGPEAVKKWVDSKGYKLLPAHLQARTLKAAKGASKVRLLGSKVPLIGYGFTILLAQQMHAQGYSPREIEKAVVNDLFYNVPGMVEEGTNIAFDHARYIAGGVMSGAFNYASIDYETEEFHGGNGLIISEMNVNLILRRQDTGGHTVRAGDLLGW